ncbi:MAG: DUF2269 domain-containing protein [Egibacteraceae bacterium]
MTETLTEPRIERPGVIAAAPRPRPSRRPVTGREGGIPRLPARVRTFVRAAHVTAAAGWLGLVVAMVVLGVSAATTGEATLVAAAYGFMAQIGGTVIPGFAVATLLTGVVLSVATPWGLIRHYWVVVKIVLTIAVIVTGVRLTGRWVEQALAGGGPAGWLLVAGSAVHLLMLGAATVISVDKPWGKTRRGHRLAAQAREQARRRRAQETDPVPVA